MAMVNLKKDPAESKKSTMLAPEYEEPAYPYGLKLNLCDEEMKALGMTELPKVGSVITFMAKATVVSVSQYEEAVEDDGDGSKVDRSASLQITDMDLGAPTGQTAADRLYRS